MAKYLILLTKEDKNTVEMALEFSKLLKTSGAEDIKICFTLEGIKALNKENEEYNLIISKHLGDIKNLNIKVYACEKCMMKFDIPEEKLVYKDKIFSYEEINKLVDQGYSIITF
jgi:hypothetical protein